MTRKAFSTLLAAFSFLLCAFAVFPHPGSQAKPSITMQITSVVNSGGAGTFKLEVILSKEVIVLLKSLPNFPESKVCSEFNTNLQGVSGWTETQQDGGLTCTASTPFTDLDGLRSITQQAFSDGSFNRLEIAGGHFYYDFAPNIGSSFTVDANMPFGVDAWWIVEVPGNVVSTNADVNSGRTLKWNLMTMNGSTHIRAESTLSSTVPGIDSTLTVIGTLCLLACCCVIILVAGGLGIFLIRRKK
jgi:hypothetical protein